MWSLNNALCNEGVQRDIIAHSAAAINECQKKPASPSLLGTRPKEASPCSRNLSTAELFSEQEQLEPRTPRVAGYFQNVAQLERSPLILTWMVLASMCLFPPCLKIISENTQACHAPFFLGNEIFPPFRTRIINYLAGSATVNAKTPVQIVLAEWQLYSRLSS